MERKVFVGTRVDGVDTLHDVLQCTSANMDSNKAIHRSIQPQQANAK